MKTEIEEHDEPSFNHQYKSKNKNVFYPMVGHKLSNTVEQKKEFSINSKKKQKGILERKRVVSIPS